MKKLTLGDNATGSSAAHLPHLPRPLRRRSKRRNTFCSGGSAMRCTLPITTSSSRTLGCGSRSQMSKPRGCTWLHLIRHLSLSLSRPLAPSLPAGPKMRKMRPICYDVCRQWRRLVNSTCIGRSNRFPSPSCLCISAFFIVLALSLALSLSAGRGSPMCWKDRLRILLESLLACGS